MKRICILIAMVFSYSSLLAEVTIRTEASFGTKRKNCLKGLGVCSAKTTTGSDSRLIASLTLSDDESVLTLGLPVAAMDELDGQIVGDKFIQDEDYAFSVEIADALGSVGIIMIPAGSYPVQYADGRLLVKISLTASPTGLR